MELSKTQLLGGQSKQNYWFNLNILSDDGKIDFSFPLLGAGGGSRSSDNPKEAKQHITKYNVQCVK